jgi:hypothetical protein
VKELLENTKNTDVSQLEKAAKYAPLFPTSVVSRIARMQGQSIDFGTSNVKGADFPVYIAGAKLLQNHPFGPLAGAALNVTLLSYDGHLDMGIHIDHSAITEPESLREHIERSFDELFALSKNAGTTATSRKKKRWFRKRT